MPISPPPEFALLPAVAVYAVHVYRRKCIDAALRVLDDTDWILNDDHTRGMMLLPTTTPNAGPGGEQDAPPSWPWVWMVPTTINGADAHAPWCTVGPTLLRVLPSGAMYPTRQWWCNYMWSLRSALHMRPSGQTVRGHLATCADILHQAASCAACMPGVYADLTLFNTLLAAKIDQAVAQVSIRVTVVVHWTLTHGLGRARFTVWQSSEGTRRDRGYLRRSSGYEVVRTVTLRTALLASRLPDVIGCFSRCIFDMLSPCRRELALDIHCSMFLNNLTCASSSS